MNQDLKKLFDRHGMPLSQRSCTGDYLWNGESLATRFHIWENKAANWRKYFPINDFQMCHELAHWLMADADQQNLPEYGMAILGDFGTTGGFSPEDFDKNRSGFLPEKEQDYLESLSYLLGYEFALACQVPIPYESKFQVSIYYLNRNEKEKLPGLLNDLENRGFTLTELEKILP